MALPTTKDLKKLVRACRAAGITSFKSEGIEFTLGDKPLAKQRLKINSPVDLGETDIETDELVGDALLYWSVGDSSTEESVQP